MIFICQNSRSCVFFQGYLALGIDQFVENRHKTIEKNTCGKTESIGKRQEEKERIIVDFDLFVFLSIYSISSTRSHQL